MPASVSLRWQFGAAVFDEARWELSIDGRVIDIEPRPLSVLQRLLRHAGEVVTKGELIEAVYGHMHVSDGALSNAIAKLRKVLGDEAQTLIVTVHRVGYRFAAPVKREEMSVALGPTDMEFVVGQPVPKRSHWRLAQRLSVRPGSEVWLAHHVKGGEARIYKFASDGNGLSALKREVTLSRVLRESLGPRVDFIAPIDWNFEAPPFFIESAYAGDSLPQWAEKQGGLAQVPLALRIELVARAADAVAAAHSVGVLHKDLKPANLLVAADGEGGWLLRVVDFGSGRLTDPERLAQLDITRMGFTQTRAIDQDSGSGTLRYLAPEVIGGHAATAQADCYALGAILYELVVGDFHKTLAPGWERDVEDPLLREDIAAAAEGDPAHRLSDAGELARRLWRLESRRAERVAAEQLAAQMRQVQLDVQRLRSRRRMLLVATSLLSFGLIVSGTLYWRTLKAETLAANEAVHAREVSDFLNRDLFSTISSGDVPLKSLTVKQLLDTAATQADKRFQTNQAAAADVHAALGFSYKSLDYFTEAKRELDAAMPLYAQLEGPGSEHQLELAEKLIEVDFVLNQLPATLPGYQRLLGQAQQRYGASALPVLNFDLELARSEVFLGRWTEGAADLHQLLQNAAAPEEENLRHQALSLLFGVEDLRGDAAVAEPIVRELLQQALAQHGGNHQAVAWDRGRLGDLLIQRGQLDAADAELTEAEAVIERWEPVTGDTRLTFAIYRTKLLIERQQALAAAEWIRRAIERWSVKPRSADELNQLAEPRQVLAKAEFYAGNAKAALSDIQLALSSASALYKPGHPQLGLIEQDLAEIQLGAGDTGAGCRTLAAGQTAWLDQIADSNPARIQRLWLQAACARAGGDHANAAALFKAARDRSKAQFGEDHWRTRRIQADLVAVQLPAG